MELVKVHEHIECPRCHVALGRHDTVCWACRHVVKVPTFYIRYVWIFMALKVGAAALLVVLLVKYRTEVEGVVQSALQSLIKSH